MKTSRKTKVRHFSSNLSQDKYLFCQTSHRVWCNFVSVRETFFYFDRTTVDTPQECERTWFNFEYETCARCCKPRENKERRILEGEL